MIHLQIKASKTDQGRVGITIVLASTSKDICPVLALLDYLGSRGSAPGPLFAHPDLQPLRRHTFVEQVQQDLTAAGVEGSQFNGHSFRIGAATSASAAGVAETTIKSWEDGRARPINAIILAPAQRTWHTFLSSWPSIVPAPNLKHMTARRQPHEQGVSPATFSRCMYTFYFIILLHMFDDGTSQ